MSRASVIRKALASVSSPGATEGDHDRATEDMQSQPTANEDTNVEETSDMPEHVTDEADTEQTEATESQAIMVLENWTVS